MADKTLAILIATEEDDTSAKIRRFLADDALHRVNIAKDGQDAWSLLQGDRFDFFIMGWRLERLSGLALLSRIRQSRANRISPAMIVSTELEQADFRLLEELPCVAQIAHPPQQREFLDRFKDLNRQKEWHENYENLLEGTMELADEDGPQFTKLVLESLRSAPNPVPAGLHASRMLQSRLQPQEAEKILRALITRAPKSLPTMTDLGKVLSQLGRAEEAVALLEKAHALSPRNIERLCYTANAQLTRGKADIAIHKLNQAKALDPDDPMTKAGLAIAEGVAHGGYPVPSPEHLKRNYASLLNGDGIAHVKRKNFAEGVRQYEAVIRLGLGRDVESRVAFNICLAYIRWGKREQALGFLKQAVDTAEEAFTKPRDLMARLTGAAAQAAAAAAAAPGVGAPEAKSNEPMPELTPDGDQVWGAAGDTLFAMEPDWLAEESIVKPAA